jgi:hypothetical protein
MVAVMGAEDSDQSLLIPNFSSAHFIELMCISQRNVPIYLCIFRSTPSSKG